MWRLLAHSLLRRRGPSLAALLGAALGVALLFAAAALGRGLRDGLETARHRLGADLLVIPFHAQAGTGELLFSGAPLNVYMDKGLADAARAVPGVRRVDAQFFTQTLTMECCGPDVAIRLVGVEPDALRRLAEITPDAGKTGTLAPDQVVVGARLIDNLGWKGSRISLLGEVFRIAFATEATGTGLDESILLPIGAARRLAAASAPLAPLWRDAGPPERLVSALLVEVDRPAPERVEAVAAGLDKIGDVRVVRPGESLRRQQRLVDAFAALLAAASLLAAGAGAAPLFGHVAATAWDRKGEWALYRALGATRGVLTRLVAGEALVLALGGAALGLPAGFALYRLAAGLAVRRGDLPFISPGAGFLLALAVAAAALYAALALLAAALPAWRVARLEPARIMAQGDID